MVEDLHALKYSSQINFVKHCIKLSFVGLGSKMQPICEGSYGLSC